MGEERHGSGAAPGSPVPRPRRPNSEDPTTTGGLSRHADPNNPDSGMISVRDLMDRVERDKTTDTGSMFPSGGIPKVSRNRAAHAAPGGTQPAPPLPPPAPREPATEIIPTITAPVAADPVPGFTRDTAPQQKSPWLRWPGRIAAGGLATALVVVAGLGWNYLRSADAGLTKVAALDVSSGDIVRPESQLAADNYLVVGADTAAATAGTGSDSIMLVHVPAAHDRVVTISFPRNLDVSRPQCQGFDNGKVSYTAENYPSSDHEKLAATYSLGGPRCLVKIMQKLTGVRINHFVGLDLAGIPAMVDDLGGVDVCSKAPLSDAELGPILTAVGTQHIDGHTALNYLRAHHVTSEAGGDADLIARQQLLMAGLMRSAVAKPGAAFLDVVRRHTMVDNVTLHQTLANVRALRSVSDNAITFATVPTSGTTEAGNAIPRSGDVTALFSALIGDSSLPAATVIDTTSTTPTTTAVPVPELGAAPSGDGTNAAPVQTAVDPSTVTVQISNDTGHGGVATTVSNKLAKYGFTIAGLDASADTTVPTTSVRYAPGHEAEAATVATAFPGADLVPDATLGKTVDVLLGTDFTGTVKTPAAVGEQIGRNLSWKTPPASPTVAVTTTTPPTTMAAPIALGHRTLTDISCS